MVGHLKCSMKKGFYKRSKEWRAHPQGQLMLLSSRWDIPQPRFQKLLRRPTLANLPIMDGFFLMLRVSFDFMDGIKEMSLRNFSERELKKKQAIQIIHLHNLIRRFRINYRGFVICM